MEKTEEKESHEVEHIKSLIKTISDYQESPWLFTGRPFCKLQNVEVYNKQKFEKNLAKNLIFVLLQKALEKKKSIDSINTESEENQAVFLEYPNSSIGIIVVRFTDNSYEIGCGTLIMQYVVLTCANLLVCDKKILKIEFYANYDEIQCLFKNNSEVMEFFTAEEYDNGYPAEDYAILILKKPLGKDCGYMGIFPITNLDLNTNYEYCGFVPIKDESKIYLIEESNKKKKKKKDMERNLDSKLKYMSSINSNFNFGNFLNPVNEKYYSVLKEEADIKLKDNQILHKHDSFKSIKGCPIFINKNQLSFFDSVENVKKHKVIILESNINTEQENLGRKEDKKTNKTNHLQGLEDDLQYYIVGINNGKSNGIFNKATLISRNRFEKIKTWIQDYAKKTGKINLMNILNIESNYVDDLFLANLPKVSCPKLTHLQLRNNSIRKEGARHISNSNFPFLIELDLAFNDIREQGVIDLCNSKNIKTIEKLNLARNKIGKNGLVYLCKTSLNYLKYLDLSLNNLKSEDMSILSNAQFNQLEYLNLTSNKILNEGLINLTNGKTKFYKTLKILNISYNKISNLGMSEFGKNNKFEILTSLDLSFNSISFESMKDFATGKLGHLKELILSENKIGDEGLISLSAGKLYSLQNLFLENCDIGDFGVFNLCKGNFPYLENLILKNNRIGDKGSGFFLDMHFTFLKFLNLEKNKIGSEGRITLARIKNCQIYIDQVN